MRTATRGLFFVGLVSMGCSSDGLPDGPAADGAGAGMNADGTGAGANAAGAAAGVGAGAAVGTGAAEGAGAGVVGAGAGAAVPVGEVGEGGEVVLPNTGSCTPGIPITSQVPRLLNREYDAVVADLLGTTALSAEGVAAPSELLNDDFQGDMNAFMWTAYQIAGAAIAAEVIGGPNQANFINCTPATSATCFEDTIRAFGRKAFRRPLTDAEVASFLTLTTITPAGTDDEIAEAILNAFLISPSFLMRTEISSEMDGAAYKLSSHEIASRLSFLVWGSVPDEVLNAAADTGMLTTKAQIMEHATRMLAVTDKTASQIAGAHRNYLVMDDASHWWKVNHDEATFPDARDDERRPAMRAEIDAFFAQVVGDGGSFQDLFLSPVGFVNQDTADLYDLEPAAYGPELEMVTLENRPGFMTRVGFLNSMSNPTATSPIFRGAFASVNLIGINPGLPADPNTVNTPIPPGDYMTRREQIEALTEPASCAVCHGQYVNPPGFVLENYDALGGWQETDSLGGVIDSTATVSITDENTAPMSTALELATAIANNPMSQEIYIKKIVSYATGRLPNDNDKCAVDVLKGKMAADPNFSVLNIISELSQTDSAILRTRGN